MLVRQGGSVCDDAPSNEPRLALFCRKVTLECLLAQMLSHVRPCATQWTAACQAPLSMEFFRQEYWSRVPLPPLRDLLDPGTEPASLMSPALAGGFFEAASTAGVDAGLGCGEEGSLVVPSYEIPTPCRPHAFLGNLLGHLRVSGQLLGKHRSQSRWGSQQDIKDSDDALPPAGHVPLGSQGISETWRSLLCNGHNKACQPHSPSSA